MNNSFKKLLLGALICLLHIVAMAADVFQPGVVLVTYKKEATPEQVAAIEAKYSLTLKRRLAAFRISFYDCTANALPPDQLSKVLAAEPSVSGASPDFGAKAQAVDTRFGEQWYLQNTGQTVGDVVGTAGIDINYVKAKSIYAPKQSILVGVVDSGITPLHPDLAGAIFAKSSETFNGLDDDGNGLVDDVFGYNWFDPINSKWPVDTFGHGTMVAGLIAATADNGQGIHGIAPTAKITAHRVFSSLGKMGSPKYANISDIIFAIASSVDDGAKIVNLSLGGGSYSSVEQQFYADLASRNVLVIAAAGNGGSDGVGDNNDVTPTYPSNYGSSAIIAVAAIDQKGVLAEFSNYGPTSVDIAAPGTNILSTDVTRKTIHAPVFSTLTGGWAPYRLAGTDFSYSQWGFYNGWVRDRIDGSTSYRASTDTFLLSPRINLSDSYGTMVSFTGVSNLADDYAWLESSSDGFNWETAYVFPKSGGSSSLKADLADYDFSSLYLRFRIKTNSYNQSNGVLIKDLKVTSVDVLDEQNPSYTITQGTSFSAPIVSGVAAMVWMHRPELTAAEVKAVILDSARKLPSLTGKVVTGGMVDAEAALKLADLRTGNVLPTLPGQPSSGSYLDGASLNLSVISTPGLPVTYQWRKNGVNISGATLSSYSIAVLRISDAGNFDVVVTSLAGSVTSSVAQVTVSARPPAITSHPALPSSAMVAGDSYEVSVSTSGTAPFYYQWMKNGLAIAGATSDRLSFSPLSSAQAGAYSVKVGNAAGFVVSNSINVAVLTRPSFTTDLPTAPISLTAGGSRMIYVLATGVPAPTYQWRKNGVNIPGATLYYYVALAGATEGANTYDVVITNSAGSATSAAATVTTNVPVTVASAPAARNVVAGAEANFSVTAAGTGPFTYQWLKNGLAIAGATNSTYSLAAASTADAGSYSVKVTNPVGSVTSSGALLSVIAPFTISAQPLGGLSSVNVSAGGSTTLSVVAAGIGPFSYQWRKNGMSISGAISSAYTVPAGSVEGSASYDVVITGPVSSLASNSVRITTCVPVVITQQPSAVVRAVGQPASFSVAATGTAPLSYQWLKNGLNIAGATGSSYSIPSTVTADAASYSVKVTGPVGAATSSSVALTLNIAPAVSTQPLNAYKALGQSASFSVVASGTGPFTYQWSKDGNAIAGANAATYSIAVVGNTDVGRYSVSVANAVGAVLSQEAELVIVTAPSILIQPMAVNATTASTTRSYRAIYFGFNHGPEGWSAVPWSGKDGDWPTSGWYWNDQIDEGLTESNLEGAAGGGETVSPLISLVGLASPELRFRVGTAGAFAIHVSTDKINWTPLFNIPAGAVTSNDPLSVSLAAFAGSSRYLRFTSTSGTWLDEVEIWGTGLAKEIVELSVATQGEGLTYQWYKDGVAVTGATSRGYVIADATVSTTAGSYTVKVSNAAGSVTSAAAKVGLAPAIAAQPIALNKASGQSASFSVAATGTGPLTYQWSKDGVQIAGATAASYSISAVSAQHIGNYSVTISNALGQATSQSVGLSVTLPPAITTQPASYTVPIEELGIYADTSFDFESGMQGWVASAGPNNQASATWVHTVSSGGGGTVRGLYCNNNSSSSAVRYITSPLISLAGITAPYVSYVSGYTSYTMTLQGNLQVEASADGVNWEFLYPPSPPSYGSPFTAGGPGSTLSSLSKYAGGNVYLRFKASGPNTGFWLDDVVVSGYKYPSGKTVSFSVTATGDGNAYQWFKNGVAVAGATAASFKVDDCRAAASLGSYTVKVTNVAGSVTSSAAVLAVPVPVITSQPQSYSGSWPSSSREVILRNGFDLGSEGWGPVGAGYPGWLWNDQRFEDGGQPSASSLEGNGYIRSPLISLAGVSGSSVTFDVSTYQAVCTLDASIDGVTWTALYSTVGSAVSEKSKTVSLAAYDGRNVYLRFYAPATGAALLDNVEVSGFSRAHTMTAAVSGFGCAYQWYKNGVAISGATAASYRISDVALAASAGSYTVRVTNAAGSVTSNAAAVPTFAAPVIVSQPSSLSVLGSTYVPYTVKNYTFTYGAEGWTYGSNFGNQAAYHWDWDSITGGITDRLYGSYYASYTDTYTQSPWISLLGVSSPVLYFTASHDLYPDSLDALDVQTSSDGVYWTTLRSIYGNGSGVYSVSLAGYQWTGCYIRYRLRSSPLYNAYGITIFDTVVSGTVVSLGQSASFSVGLSASAGCTFQWYKNNIAISGANSSSYYISNTYASDAGVYKVVVTNPVGSVTSASATLTVR